MGKRLVFIVTTILITGIAAGWYFFAKESRDFGTSPLKAIPVESPYFIRIRNLGDFAEKTVNNRGWKSIRDLKGLSGLYTDLGILDSLFKSNKQSENFLKHKELVVVPIEKTNLFLLEIGSIAEKNSIQSMVKNFFLSKTSVTTAGKYKNCSFQKYEWTEKAEKRQMLIAYYRGILMFVNDPDPMRNAVDQMDLPSVLDNADFLRINKTSTENIDLNIFINHKIFPLFLSDYLTDSLSNSFLHKNLASWTEVDIIQKECQWLVNGFTVSDTTLSCFADVFKRQKPLPESLTSYMPSATSFFIIQNLSSPANYFEDYNRYLQKNVLIEPYKEQLSSLSKVLQLNLEQYFTVNWTGEAAIVFTNQNLEDSSDNRFFLMKVKPARIDPLVNAIKRWSAGRKDAPDTDQSEAAESNIWKVPADYFGKLIGESCFGAVKTKWMTAGDGYILMGSTPGSIRRYLNFLQRKDLLQDDPSYLKYTSEQAKSSSFFMWSRPGISLPFMEPILKPALFQSLCEGIPTLNKVDNISWQWGYENGMIYNSAILSVNPEAKQIPTPFWQYPRKVKMRTEAFFVRYSAKSKVKDLVFQDAENYLTDIDSEGSERWKISLEGAIIGGIKIIDLSGNGEFQLLFNTRDAIHLINRKGFELKSFPVKLKASATNQVAVFDYDGKKDYRYLIACSDHKVYNFDKYGKATFGWQPKAVAGIVEFPVQHYRYGSKDYLIFADKVHTNILDRQGKERVKVQGDFSHSRNSMTVIKNKEGRDCMVGTDEHGKIRMIGFDGSVRMISCGNFSAGHFFLPVKFTNEGKSNFIFFDKNKLSMFDLSGKELFSIVVEANIDQFPKMINIGQEQLIALNSAVENRTILVRKDGSIFDKFTPENCMLVALDCNDDQNRIFHVMVSTLDGFLSNYQILVK